MPKLSATAAGAPRRLVRLHRAVAAGLLLAWSLGDATACRAQPALPPAPAATDAAQPATDATSTLLNDRPIGALKATIAAPGPTAPENLAAPRLRQEGVQPQVTGLGRGWCLEPYEWDAPATRNLPLYFEEPNLERLGYYYGWPCDGRVRRALFCNVTEYMETVHDDSPVKQAYFSLQDYLDSCQPQNQILQPMVSAANFYGRAAILPYMLGAECALEPIYTLGYDLPGSPRPYRKYYAPLSLKGALLQAGAVTGLVYIIP